MQHFKRLTDDKCGILYSGSLEKHASQAADRNLLQTALPSAVLSTSSSVNRNYCFQKKGLLLVRSDMLKDNCQNCEQMYSE